MPDIAHILISVVSGFAVGILSGVLGIGGGSLFAPLCRLVLGLPVESATATSLFAIMPTSATGAFVHFKNKTCIVKLAVLMGIGGASTSALGVYLNLLSPSWLVMLTAACILLYTSGNMFTKAFKMKKAIATTQPQLKKEERIDPASIKFTPKSYVQAILTGALAGLLAGYVGVGGGFILIPVSMALFGIPMIVASGTSLLAIIILALPALAEQAMSGHIDFLVGLVVSLGSVPGAYFGSKIASKVPEQKLRVSFGIFLIFAAALLVLNETLLAH